MTRVVRNGPVVVGQGDPSTKPPTDPPSQRPSRRAEDRMDPAGAPPARRAPVRPSAGGPLDAIAPGAIADPQDLDALQALFAPGRPVARKRIPEALRKRLQAGLRPELRRLASVTVHDGLANPFDFAALSSISPPERAALTRYLDPDFVRRSPVQKAETLDRIDRLILSSARAFVRGFHLPQPLNGDPAAAPVTYSMEAEGGLQRRPEILDYYAPDKTGALDPRALPDSFLDGLLDGRRGWLCPEKFSQSTLRMSRRGLRERLRWRDLTYQGRIEFLKHYQGAVDPKVQLKRIDQPSVAPQGRTAPRTLDEDLLWEGSPMGTAEVVTGDKYDSLDLLLADVAFVQGIGDARASGFHTHHVVELSSPEQIRRDGPSVVGLIALQDLQLFTQAGRQGYDVFENLHLEVWQADGIEDCASSLAKGTIDSDELSVHKFHTVGLRTDIYGKPERIGIEIRAVPPGDTTLLAKANLRMSKILTEGHLAKVEPRPPWSFWNAGDPALPDRAYRRALANPNLSACAEKAEVDFDSIYELAGSGSRRKLNGNTFRYAAPLWNFEGLPGVTPEEKETIEAAREAYLADMLKISQGLTTALESGRDLPERQINQAVRTAARRFLQTAQIDVIVDRTLDRLSKGKSP